MPQTDDPARELFFKMPAVQDFVSRYPSTKHALRPDVMTATYLDQAMRAGYRTKQIFEDLDIPWVLRLVKEECPPSVVGAARILPPSVFSQTRGDEAWGNKINKAHRLGVKDTALVWVAFHAREISEGDIYYIATLNSIHRSTSAQTVVKRSHEWRAQFSPSAILARIRKQEEQEYLRMFNLQALETDTIEGFPEEAKRFTHRGFEFVALTTFDDFLEEKAQMRSYIASNFHHALTLKSLHYSVRRDGKRFATCEIGRDGTLHDIRTFANGDVNIDTLKMAQSAARLVAAMVAEDDARKSIDAIKAEQEATGEKLDCHTCQRNSCDGCPVNTAALHGALEKFSFKRLLFGDRRAVH